MKLTDFLNTPEGGKVSKAEWGRRAGITRGYISQLAEGVKTPSLEVALRIEKATAGKVTPHDWIDPGKLEVNGVGGNADSGLRGQTT